ncbi:threonine/serine exporter family protein [Clostridium hydrogeniformans]|uniref:threonine/serine exporter family protein n=1 Tax=Clostridium hydrogeniformans TaxID=349933 RepID=UPI000487D66C|nr:threonine/serine exporter family protein [Clostridium hydrogeniformans]
MFIKTFYAAMSTLGFGIIFNIKGKNLFAATIGGGLGWLFYEIALYYGLSDVTSLFIGAVALSAYSEILARVLKAPVTTFVICALIPLVPGGGMYYTMLASIQGNVYKSLELGLKTLSGAGAIAVGVILTSSIARFINYKIYINKNKTLRKSS